jgi:hypothetical protein
MKCQINKIERKSQDSTRATPFQWICLIPSSRRGIPRLYRSHSRRFTLSVYQNNSGTSRALFFSIFGVIPGFEAKAKNREWGLFWTFGPHALVPTSLNFPSQPQATIVQNDSRPLLFSSPSLIQDDCTASATAFAIPDF